MKKEDCSPGFTLIEIAIVLVIVGTLLSFGAGLISTLSKRAKNTATDNKIDASVDSITSYAATNKGIPTGISGFQSNTEAKVDAWTKEFYYFDEPLLNANDTICARKTTDLMICKATTCSAANEKVINVAFAVISSGENYNPQTGLTTTNCPAGKICLRVYDTGTAGVDACTSTTDCPATNFPSTSQRISRATDSYDDIVRWVTLDELRTKAGCQGGQLTILNTELPSGRKSDTYKATIIADGGVEITSAGTGKYRWCFEAASVPTGISICAGMTNLTATVDCSGAVEETWGRGDTAFFALNAACAAGSDLGTSISDSYSFTFYVRDYNDTVETGINDDNIYKKTFVLTISP